MNRVIITNKLVDLSTKDGRHYLFIDIKTHQFFRYNEDFYIKVSKVYAYNISKDKEELFMHDKEVELYTGDITIDGSKFEKYIK